MPTRTEKGVREGRGYFSVDGSLMKDIEPLAAEMGLKPREWIVALVRRTVREAKDARKPQARKPGPAVEAPPMTAPPVARPDFVGHKGPPSKTDETETGSDSGPGSPRF